MIKGSIASIGSICFEPKFFAKMFSGMPWFNGAFCFLLTFLVPFKQTVLFYFSLPSLFSTPELTVPLHTKTYLNFTPLMENKSTLFFKLELIWWAFTALIALAILYPILSKIDSYPFWVTNTIFVIVFITFTRYIFLLKYTFLAQRPVFKIVLIGLSLPILFYLINGLNFFQAFIGEEGLAFFMPELSYQDRESLGIYIRNEMVLFGTGSIITGILFPLRMLMSIWRNHNRGTV